MVVLCLSSAQAMQLFTETTEENLKEPLIRKSGKTGQQRLEWSCSRKWEYWWGTSCLGCFNDAAKIAKRLSHVLCTKAWQDLEPPVFSYDDPFPKSVYTPEQQKNNWHKNQLALKNELQFKLEKIFYNDLKDHGLGPVYTYAHRFWENRDETLEIIESNIQKILSRQKETTLESAEKQELAEELDVWRKRLEQRNVHAALDRAVHRPNFPLLWISSLEEGHICGKESLHNLRGAVEFWKATYGPHTSLKQLLEVMNQPHCRPLLPHQENFEGLLPELKVKSGRYTVPSYEEFLQETDFDSRPKSAEIWVSTSEKEVSGLQNNKSTSFKNNMFCFEAPK